MRFVHRDSVARSTPFRLALFFAAFFLAALAAGGLIAFELMRWELYRRHDEEVARSYSVIAAAYNDDVGDFIDTIRTNVNATHHHESVYLAMDAKGAVLAGNIRAIDLPDGWSTVPGRRLGLNTDKAFRILAGKVRNDRLIVGESFGEIDALEEIALGSFAWASGLVVMLALAGGTVIGLRARRRFRAVRETMNDIARGELAARIPLLGKGDDIDLLASEINDALQRLQMTLEGMRQVSTDIAHDLKTPLYRLRIELEEARRKQERGLAVAAELDAAVQEADQVNRTFDALLRIAQIESGARKTRFTTLDLNEVLRDVADLYRGAVEDAGFRLDISLPSGACTISGDRELLTQMFANLIENAIRHCPPGTLIRIASTTESAARIVTVEDNGPGVPAAEHESVFRRLYRLERSRNTPGTGLGLSLVKSIADLHGASIALGDAGPGLKVTVRFLPA
ncbi:MAG: ATP-binding protein [Rhizobiaceae bacterium]